MSQVIQYGKKALTLLCMTALMQSAQAGTLWVSQLGASSQNTVVTQCVNTKGFYFEIGSSKVPLVVTKGFGRTMPLSAVIKNTLPLGWAVSFGAEVIQNQPVAYKGPYTWTERLKWIAIDNNLAVIVDWNRKHVYINRL